MVKESKFENKNDNTKKKLEKITKYRYATRHIIDIKHNIIAKVQSEGGELKALFGLVIRRSSFFFYLTRFAIVYHAMCNVYVRRDSFFFS